MAEPVVHVQHDPCNNRYSQVWCWRLTADGHGARQEIDVALVSLCSGMRVLQKMWDEQPEATSCLVAALALNNHPKAAYGKRYGKLGASDRDKLLAVYQSQGIQACYAAFPSHSQASLNAILNHMGMGSDGKRRRPHRAT